MKVVFMGTPNAAIPALERLIIDGLVVEAVYTQPDRPKGRGRRPMPSPIKEFALSHGLRLFQPTTIKSHEAVEQFKSHKSDVTIVVAYGRILPKTWLDAFPMGAINVHFSLLPKFRGAAPVNWAIVNGEIETGVTTMRMDAGLDTGDILLQRTTPIEDSETSIQLMERLAVIGADLLSETLSKYSEISSQPQDENQASYAPLLKKEDGLISWMLSAREIVDRVRGFQPFPTAFIYRGDKKLTLWKCRVVDAVHTQGRIGEVVEAHGDVLRVFCGGDSILQIDELQLEGKRRMTTRDFLNGTRVRLGERLA